MDQARTAYIFVHLKPGKTKLKRKHIKTLLDLFLIVHGTGTLGLSSKTDIQQL